VVFVLVVLVVSFAAISYAYFRRAHIIQGTTTHQVKDTASPALVPTDSNKLETTSVQDAEVDLLLQDWQSAWQGGNIRTYADFYSPDFSGRNYSAQTGYRIMNRAQWLSDKENKFRRQTAVFIELGPITIEHSGDDAVVSFLQSYRSATYSRPVAR
jgi:hypothetical protein